MAKRLRTMIAASAGSALLLAVAGLSATSAEAAPAQPSIVVAGPAVVTATPQALTAGATTLAAGAGAAAKFYPTGPVAEDALVIIPNDDGTLPFGLTQAQVKKLAALEPAQRDVALAKLIGTQPSATVTATSMSAAAPVATATSLGGHTYSAAAVWSAPWTGDNIWGYDSTARVTYSFNVTAGTNQQAAGQGLGYYRGYNGSTLGTWSAWYGLGIASDGAASGGSVPWGSVLAPAQFKAKSTIALHLAFGSFWP